MAFIKNPLSGGGGGTAADIVNGLFEKFKTGTSPVNANNFVQFLNSSNGHTSQKISGTITPTTIRGTGVALEQNKTFLAINNQLVVVEIDGVSVTSGTAVVFGGDQYSAQHPVLCPLDSSTVMVFYTRTNASSSGSGRSGAVIATVSGTTITLGTSVNVGTSANSGMGKAMSKLSSTSTFLTYRSATTAVYGRTATISGTTISLNTTTSLSITDYSTEVFGRALTIDSGTVVSSLTAESVYTPKFTLWTIASDEVTIVNSVDGVGKCGDDFEMFLISSTEIVATGRAHAADSGSGISQGELIAGILTVSSTLSITTAFAGLDIISNHVADSGYGAVQIDATHFLATYSKNTYQLWYVICTIENGAITAGTEMDTHSGDSAPNYTNYLLNIPVIFDNDDILITHTATNTSDPLIYTKVLPFEYLVEESSTIIDGLTTTAGSKTTVGKLWILNTNA